MRIDWNSSRYSVAGAGAWLDAHYDPVASLYTFSSCMGEPLPYKDNFVQTPPLSPALEDLSRDGDHKVR